jgi:hypothetical protein
LLAWLALGAIRQGALQEAARLAERAVALVDGVGDPALLAFALEQRATVAFDGGQLMTAARIQRLALELAEQAGDDVRRSRLLVDLYNSQPAPADVQAAEAALQMCRRRGDAWTTTLILLNLAANEIDLEHYEAAIAMMDDCCRNHGAVIHASPPLAMQLFLNRGLARLGASRQPEAARDLADALRHAYCAGNQSWALDAVEGLVPALADSSPEDAAWLDGLAARLAGIARSGPPEPLVERLRASTLPRLQERLGASRVESLRRAGADATFGDAVERLDRTGVAT